MTAVTGVAAVTTGVVVVAGTGTRVRTGIAAATFGGVFAATGTRVSEGTGAAAFGGVFAATGISETAVIGEVLLGAPRWRVTIKP